MIIIPESNLISIPYEIRTQIRKLNVSNVVFMNELDKKKSSSNTKMKDLPGSVTTKNTKQLMVLDLIKVLTSKKIIFYYDFIVSQNEFTNLTIPIKAELINQFRSFSKIKKQSNNPEVGTEIFYNGKIKQGNDDFVMGILINLASAKRFFIEDQFKCERKNDYIDLNFT